MRKYLLLALSLVVVGCSGFLSGKSNLPTPKELDASLSQTLVNVMWSAKTNSSTKNRDGLRFNIGHDGGNIYVAGANGNVSAIDLSSGQTRWSRSVGKLYSGTSAANGVVLVGSRSGNLIALSAGDGSDLWSQKLYGSPVTSPVSDGSLAIVRTLGGAVEAFDLLTGDERWAYLVATPDMGNRGGAAPVVYDGRVLVPNGIGQLGLLNADDGDVIWGVNIGKMKGTSLMNQLRDIDASPIVTENRIFAATTQNGVSAVTHQGQALWNSGKGVQAGIAYDGHSVIAVERDSRIISLSDRDGSMQWENNDLIGRWLTEPQVIGSRILVGDFEGYVHVLDANSGMLLGSTKVASNGFMPDTLEIGSTMLLLDQSGGVYRVGI